MTIKVNDKVNPSELSENCRKGDVRWGERPKKEGWLVELVSDQSPGPEAPPRCRRGGSKGNVSGGATAKGMMEKGRYVTVINGEEVRRNDPIEYFLPMEVFGILPNTSSPFLPLKPQRG